MRGALLTLLGLTALQALLSGTSDVSRLGQLGSAVAKGIGWVTNPDIALVPDFRPGHATNASPTLYSTSTATASVTPAVNTTPVAPTPSPARTYTA